MGGNQSGKPGFTGSSWPKNRSWRLRCDFEGIFKACLLRFLEFFCPLRFQDAFKSILTDKIDRKYSPKLLKIEKKIVLFGSKSFIACCVKFRLDFQCVFRYFCMNFDAIKASQHVVDPTLNHYCAKTATP